MYKRLFKRLLQHDFKKIIAYDTLAKENGNVNT